MKMESYEGDKKKKWTAKEDAAFDRAHKVKPGSKQDKALDKKRGIR